MALDLKPLLVIGDFAEYFDDSFLIEEKVIAKAVSLNYEISHFDLIGKKIGRCQKCGSCFSKEVACSYLDDFNALAPLFFSCDNAIIILGKSPSDQLSNLCTKLEILTKRRPRIRNFFFLQPTNAAIAGVNEALLSSLPGEVKTRLQIIPVKGNGDEALQLLFAKLG